MVLLTPTHTMQPRMHQSRNEIDRKQAFLKLTVAENAFDQYHMILAVLSGSFWNSSWTIAIILDALMKTATTDGAYLCRRLSASSGQLSARIK